MSFFVQRGIAPRGTTVVVYTKKPDDRTIRGVMVAEHVDRVTLQGAFVVQGKEEQELGGLVHIPIRSISFVQEIRPE